MEEAFRRYLQVRMDLGEPELVLPDMDRRGARRMARRMALGGVLDAAARPRAEGDGDGGGTAPGGPGAGGAVTDRDEWLRLSREGSPEEIRSLPNLDALSRVATRCVRCRLHESRKTVVFGEGDPDARVLCVGEAPGAREDETGRPFVGAAGRLLDRLLLSVGWAREDVYICNVLKCRPPRNRDPRPDEIEACAPYLARQIELVDPDVVIAFGAFASRTLLRRSDSLGAMRGRVHRYGERPLVVTYHPAALLRNPRWRRPTWEDLQRVRRVLDGEIEPDGESVEPMGV